MGNEILNAAGYISEDYEIYEDHQRPEMFKYVPVEASTILDVGCAVGGFGKGLKTERTVHVTGIETNEYAASQARLYLDDVICGDFGESLKLPHNHFDCIVFNTVLEHMADPFSALVYAKKLLNSQGVIVISIPNVRYFDNVWKMIYRKDWKYEQLGVLDRTHLRFFTRKSMIETLEELGYEIDQIDGIELLKYTHPGLYRRYKILNTIFLNNLEDMAYQQFAIVAHPVS